MSVDDKIEVANEVLKSFAPGTSLRLCPTGYVMVQWTSFYPPFRFEKRWMTRGQDFYPVWHRQWGHGGTASTALAQLVRWCKGKTVLPLSSWRYWAGETCRLLRQQDDNGEAALKALLDGGYPETVPCVLCGSHDHIGDWWSLKKVVGPCCSMRGGCKQARKETAK